jgi:hypothetical protein
MATICQARSYRQQDKVKDKECFFVRCFRRLTSYLIHLGSSCLRVPVGFWCISGTVLRLDNISTDMQFNIHFKFCQFSRHKKTKKTVLFCFISRGRWDMRCPTYKECLVSYFAKAIHQSCSNFPVSTVHHIVSRRRRRRSTMAEPEKREAEPHDLDKLIENHAWDEVYAILASSSEEAQKLMLPSHNWTKFHWLCSIGSVPTTLIGLIASLHPEAITMPDNHYGDTPLHIICRNSQTQAVKIKILLQYCRDTQGEGVLIRNHFGGTALHSACHHNARLDALEALVHAEPRILRVKTNENVHAVAAMYNSYIQTIPGYMAVAHIVAGEDDKVGGHFERFWKKVEFLATEYFKQTAANPRDAKDHSQFALHGLIQCYVPINLFKVALKRNPEWMQAVDASGNLPLHLLIENRPYRLKEKEAIVAAIQAAPQTVGRTNIAGDTALVIAIRNKIPWENGVDELLKAATAVVNRRDAVTGLYPFQLSASVGGKVAMETTYHLLRTMPELISQ